jgi:hypothetical protein
MLVAKNTNIYHAEIPAALIPKDKTNNKKCPGGDCPGEDRALGRGDEKGALFLLYNPSNNVHPKIKAKFIDGLLKQVSNITLSNIYTFCNTTVTALLPDDKHCALYMMGMCHCKKCDHKHKSDSDTKAEHTLTFLKKTMKNPESLKADQGK